MISEARINLQGFITQLIQQLKSSVSLFILNKKIIIEK